jgi:hypothetical protein
LGPGVYRRIREEKKTLALAAFVIKTVLSVAY